MKTLKENGYTRAVDWWAVGILLYEMLVGRLPFEAKSATTSEHQTLFDKILYEDLFFPCDLSQESRTILSHLLAREPSQRLGASRLDFDEVKQHPFFSQIDWSRLYNKELETPFRPSVSSDTDTCYFEAEFTGENVQLTPPDAKTRLELTNEINYFDKFSFYGSKTSLNSRKSHVSMKSNSCRIDKFDTHSLVNNDFPGRSKSNHASSEYLPSPQTPHSSKFSSGGSSQQNEELDEHPEISSTIYLASNAFPQIIQFTDDTGQSFRSKAYFTGATDDDANDDADAVSEMPESSSKSSSSEASNFLAKNRSHTCISGHKAREFPKINLNYKYLLKNYDSYRETFECEMDE